MSSRSSADSTPRCGPSGSHRRAPPPTAASYDRRRRSAPPRTASVRDALAAVLGPAPDWGPAVTRARRDLLLPALHAAHDADGWLAPSALGEIAARLGLGRAEVYGVASFYGSLSLVPRPRQVRRVCVDVVSAAG